MDGSKLLEVTDLTCVFRTADRSVYALNHLSLHVRAGEVVAVVGESGCGKSAAALAIMGLLPASAMRSIEGSIRFDGRDLLGLSARQWRGLRGQDIGMIFQDPMTALNPMMTIGDQIGEVLREHTSLGKREIDKAVVNLLEQVRIPDAVQRRDEYPHQLSGGMRQRVVIAMAIACRPKLIIADEPTTALDVTIQAQILELLKQLRSEVGSAIMLISHDLGVVGEIADRMVVMYAGTAVEVAPTDEILRRPRHRYTAKLIAAAPDIDRVLSSEEGAAPVLAEIPGVVPQLSEPPLGCIFRDRCSARLDICAEATPPLEELAPGHWAACWNPASTECGS